MGSLLGTCMLAGVHMQVPSREPMSSAPYFATTNMLKYFAFLKYVKQNLMHYYRYSKNGAFMKRDRNNISMTVEEVEYGNK